MDCFKSKCPCCGHIIYWMGSNTFFVKIDYPVCFRCGTQTREQDKSIDRESIIGRTYELRLLRALMDIPDIHWDIQAFIHEHKH